MKRAAGFSSSGSLSRRQFLRSAGAAAVAGAISAQESSAATPPPETLRVGLIGCGGRGTGAVNQALRADPDVELVAMGDAFADRLEKSLRTLKGQEGIAEKVAVGEESCFVGFDAYEKVIASGVDVVLLATPPHFRPLHLKAAVEVGKHVFAEKPVAVDAPGVRSVLATSEEARRKGLSIVSGLCLRYSRGFREAIGRIQEGALGTIRAMQATDLRGPLWVKPREPGMTDMEYQMRNWYYFTWLSGDYYVEQHVHNLDVCSWVMNDEYPVSAIGVGGRQIRTGDEYGNIYDHHAVVFEYENGVKLYSNTRQQPNCANDVSAQVMGGRGVALLTDRDQRISTEETWVFQGENDNFFQAEHDELFASIRSGHPINNGDYMARSTLLAIMGRMATYTGKKITWEQALSSQEDLSPGGYDWKATPPESPIAIPGVTRFV